MSWEQPEPTVEGVTPPHSMVDEQSVLGALLMDNAAFDQAGAILKPADFYTADHGRIYAAIVALIVAGKPADVVTVFERLGTGDAADLKYLNELVQAVTSTRNIKAYAETVRERALRRQVVQLARQLADDALRGRAADRPVVALIDQAVTQLLALQQAGASTEPRDMESNLAAFLDDLNDRADGEVRTMRTGLSAVDKLTADGGRRGELWVLGARPSMGKSAFVLQLCRYVGQAYSVLLLTQEDSNNTATARFVAAAGRVNLADLRNPRAAPDSMWHGVTEGMEELRPLQVSMDDQTGLTLADVRRKCRQVRRRCGRLDLVVIDYLQLMDDGGDNRNQALGLIANSLKRLAKELNVWVVLLSQLNRKADERTGPPQMGDLRDSGDIEGAADFIGLLYREHMRKPTAENKHWAQLHVAKQKNGPTDTLNLHFDGALQRFSDWEGPPPFRSGKGGGNYTQAGSD